MTRIPALRIPALFGALVLGFLPLSIASASASPVLTGDSAYADTASQQVNTSATLGDDGRGVGASTQMKYVGGDWHGVTLSDAKAFTIDPGHLSFLPAIVSTSIISGGKGDMFVGLPVALQITDGDVHPRKSFFASVVSTVGSIPLSLPLFGLGLIVISLIARRTKKGAASLT